MCRGRTALSVLFRSVLFLHYTAMILQGRANVRYHALSLHHEIRISSHKLMQWLDWARG